MTKIRDVVIKGTQTNVVVICVRISQTDKTKEICTRCVIYIVIIYYQ